MANNQQNEEEMNLDTYGARIYDDAVERFFYASETDRSISDRFIAESAWTFYDFLLSGQNSSAADRAERMFRILLIPLGSAHIGLDSWAIPLRIPEDYSLDFLYDSFQRKVNDILHELVQESEEEAEELVGLSVEELDQLPTSTATEAEVGSCTICYEDYEQGVQLRSLPCSHYFHKGCVDQWLEEQEVCPFCRQNARP